MLGEKIKRSLLGVVAFVFVAGLSGYTDAAKPVREPEAYSPPTWSIKLDSTNGDDVTGCGSSRFECVLDGEAVLDKETGLVWDKTPDTGTRTWTQALTHCFKREVGGRKGWRAPTIEEILSLSDEGERPVLPGGHPFLSAPGHHYWSSTTAEGGDPGRAFAPIYDGAPFGEWLEKFFKNSTLPVWCVRGGQGYDAY